MRPRRFSACVLVFMGCLLSFSRCQAEPRPVTAVNFFSKAVARQVMFNIILSKGYKKSDKRYPVLYLLHGRAGDHDYWTELGVPEYAASYDLIVVMPSVGPSWYVNWAASTDGKPNNWEDCVTRDLIGYVDTHYRTVASREGRAISGKSMGGYGALMLGLRNPDLFSSASSIAGGLRFIDKLREHLNGEGPDPLFPDGKMPESKREMIARTPRGRMVTTLEECDAIDPFTLVLGVPAEQLPDIRIDCGLDDGLVDYSQRLARLLMEHKIPFTFAQAPGAHTPEYGARAVRNTMSHQYAVMMKQLGGSPPTSAAGRK